jgi:hypothetical protein
MKLHKRFSRLTVLSAAIGIFAVLLSGCGGGGSSSSSGSGSSGAGLSGATVSGSSGALVINETAGSIQTGTSPAPTMVSASGLSTASPGGTFTVNVTAPDGADTLYVGAEGQGIFFTANLTQKSVALSASRSVPPVTRQAGAVYAVTFAIASQTTASSITFEAVTSTSGVYSAPATLQVTLLPATGGSNDGAPVVVQVRPAAVSLSTGGTVQLQSYVANANNTAVIWSVDGGSANGTVVADSSPAGSATYTAPATAGQYTIRATSVVNGSATGTATANVVVPISIAPTSTTIVSGNTVQFSALVASGLSPVAWTVIGGSANGTISTSGLYTAPTVTSTQTFTVQVTSQVDTTKFATATVTVVPNPLTVTPPVATLSVLGTQQFTGLIQGTVPSASSGITIAYSIVEGNPGGTISTTGLYTAPAAPGTYHVLVTATGIPTSISPSPTASAQATVTVQAGGPTTVIVQ